MKKNKYEISLWEDRLVPKSEIGGNIIPEHYEEEKICIIGSDTMTSQARALEPKLVRNINGTNKLTFKIYYTYIDNETGEKIQNPFISLLTNEKKVKCKWGDEWYDFIIKNIQEDSNGKTITYSCEDLYVNELSKTGFNLIFDQELNNNQGTAQELAKKVLEGTDWTVDIDNSDHILQTIEEPLYRAIVNQKFEAQDKEKNKIIVLKDSIIYIFYSVLQETASSRFFQFIYNENNSYEAESNSQVLKENNCYSVDIANWEIWSNEYLTIEKDLSNYRGKRLVRQQLQEFNHALNRNCYVYKDGNKKIFGYTTVEYKDPTVVTNLISNPSDFSNIEGWGGSSWTLYPPFSKDLNIDSYSPISYLKTSGNLFNSGIQDCAGYLEEGLQAGQKFIFRILAYGDNTGKPGKLLAVNNIEFNIYDYFNSIETTNTIPVHNTSSYCEVVKGEQVGQYRLTKDTYWKKGKTYYSLNESGKDRYKQLSDDDAKNAFKNSSLIYENIQFLQFEIQIKETIPKKELTAGHYKNYIVYDKNNNPLVKQKDVLAHPGIFLNFNNGETGNKKNINAWIEEAQFYPLVKDADGRIIHPEDLDLQSHGTTYYKYFDANVTYEKEEDIKYIYSGTDPQSYTKVYDEGENFVPYEKIRSITAKKSNRFNILQSIAETFQCWIRFKIYHDSATGRITYVEGRPKKVVAFKENIGEETGYGFVYGIDLKTISRSIDSSQLTTKVIVAPNTIEYADDGICGIGKSDLNESGEDYILDFGYYISQGLLESGAINKELYLSNKNELGFYPFLKEKNKKYLEVSKELEKKKTELTRQTSFQTTYNQYISSARTEIDTLKENLRKLAGYKTYKKSSILAYLKKNSDDEEATKYYATLVKTQQKLKNYQSALSLLNKSIKTLQESIKANEKTCEGIVTAKKKRESEFYQKFSRFIQEGSWTSQDYIDNNLYYLDARSVAYTSSRPKVSYNISVIRLNALDEFKGKKFRIGDISYIEDKEFFGYVKGDNGWTTPYKEKVLISESTSYFDSPEKDTFTIQNYKTQFEDLFQRITATTQSLQYASGEYQRAADIVEGKGVINSEALQNSISINNNLVFKSQNEEIFQDSTGLTLTDKRDPSKRTKLTSGGLFISTDGGKTWKNAVRGEGIATQYLTTGSIDTNKISISDGIYPTFRWDKYGINAFNVSRDPQTNELQSINKSQFVRFDQFGIYGLSNENDETYVPDSENQIWNDAQFGMTWQGFFLKNKDSKDKQQIEISTKNDICVSKKVNNKPVEKIKIGCIGTVGDKKIYGLRFKNDNDNPTLEMDETGLLWLKDKLKIADILYRKTKDDVVKSSKTYYTEDSTGHYIKVDSPENAEIGNYWELTSSGVEIGNLGEDKEGKYPVFNSNNNFIVYEDGSILAKNGDFKGTIEAIAGKIGGFIIQDSELSNENVILSPNGITIRNDGVFSIYEKNSKDPVFVANEKVYSQTEDTTVQNEKTYYKKDENGNYTQVNLTVGEPILTEDNIYEAISVTRFKGQLEGATGNFSGEIAANSGRIGGFVIADDFLSSEAVYTWEEKEDGVTVEKTAPRITLNGVEGKVYARSIELGEDATISTCIKLGNAEIWNPDASAQRLFLKAGKNFRVYDDGKLTLDGITLDGSLVDPKIIGHDGDGYQYWSISKDSAVFNKVVAKSGTIENVVFKNSVAQGAGGIMFFKLSYSGNVSSMVYQQIKPAVYQQTEDTSINSNKTYYKKDVEGNYIEVTNPLIEEIKDYWELISSAEFEVKSIEIVFEEATQLKAGDNVLVKGLVGDIKTINIIEKTIEEGTIGEEGTEDFKKDTAVATIVFKQDVSKEFEERETVSVIKRYNLSSDGAISDSLLIGINSTSYNDIDYNNGIQDDYNLFRGGLTIISPVVTTEEEYAQTNDKEPDSNKIYYKKENEIYRKIEKIPEDFPLEVYEVIKTEKIVYPHKPSLFLGDLRSVAETGFGLYSDNVFLNGTLTTRDNSGDESIYSGMNTVNGLYAKTEFFPTVSKVNAEKIVFWAGARRDEKTSKILSNEAPFQVTEKGNLYASAGIFKDSILSNSVIQGSILKGVDIFTAKIHGWTGSDDERGELKICNTSNGISFVDLQYFITKDKIPENGKIYYQQVKGVYQEITNLKNDFPSDIKIYECEENKLFSIKADGFEKEDVKFILVSDNKIDFQGTSFLAKYLKDDISSNFKIEPQSDKTTLSFFKNEEKNDKGNTIQCCELAFLEEKITASVKDKTQLEITDKKVNVKTTLVANEDVKYGLSLEYKPVFEEIDGVTTEIGYDLYIKNDNGRRSGVLGKAILGWMILGNDE